jgi:hypothetical protein
VLALQRWLRLAEVGISLGDVVLEDGDVYGAPVVEAARLVAIARPRRILCTELVRRVAGGRAAAPFTDIGPHALSGVPDPVAVCEVRWMRLPELAAVHRPGCIGMGHGLPGTLAQTRPWDARHPIIPCAPACGRCVPARMSRSTATTGFSASRPAGHPAPR